MRIVTPRVLQEYGPTHPRARASIEQWIQLAKGASWRSTQDVLASHSKAKVLNAERVRFEISGEDHRLIVAFDFRNGVAFIKFIGTQADYDRVDALTVSRF